MHLTWGGSGQGGVGQARMSKNPLATSVSKVQARLYDLVDSAPDQPHIRSPFRDGCTNIPLAAVRAQENETILLYGTSGHGALRFVHLDPPGLIRSWKI